MHRWLCSCLFLLALPARLPAEDFIRGDINGDGVISISDAHFLEGYLFLGRASPECSDAADVDDSGQMDLSDTVSILNFRFADGPPPPSPFPGAGADPTADEQDCLAYGNGAPLDDPAAKLEIGGVAAPGGEDRKVFIPIAVSSSKEIGAYSFKIRDDGHVLDLQEGASVAVFGETIDQANNGGFASSRVAGGDIEIAVIMHFTRPYSLPAAENANLLQVFACLKAGTTAGEYSLSLPDGELSATSDPHWGRAIHPALVGGTLSVLADVLGGTQCEPPGPPPPPPPPVHVRFQLAKATGVRGGSVSVPFSIRSDRASQGFSYSIHFDEAVLLATGTDKLFIRADGTPYEFETFEENNESGFVVGAAIISLSDTEEVLPPNEDIDVLEFDFAVSATAPVGSTELEFLDGGRGSGGPVRNKLIAGGQTITPEASAGSFVFVNGLVNIVPDGTPFVRGDANTDIVVNISDPTFTLNYLFRGGDTPRCLDAADANDDGRLDLSDPIATLQFLFFGDTRLPPPNVPGQDPTEDGLGGCLF